MQDAAKNAPLFVEAFYEACESLRTHHPELGLPDLVRINRVLFENQAGYEIRPPDLISLNPHVPIVVPDVIAQDIAIREFEQLENSV
jgi:hypothetical protein